MHQNKAMSSKQAKDTPSRTPTEKKVSKHKTPWEIASKLVARIPKEAWDKIPADLSVNADHYLYGAPKQEKP
jgi:hypothetical protein